MKPYRPSHAMRLLLGFCERLPQGQLSVTLPDGETRLFGPGGTPHAAVTFHRDRIARRMLMKGMLGFCEAYLDGDWTSPDADALFRYALENQAALQPALRGKGWLRLARHVGHLLRPNSRTGARRNIRAHYDLGNDFYARWLDTSMTYSSALFERPDEPLEAAQQRKYAALAEKLRLQPDQRLLEIGCGWGGFAEYAAREHGCQVVGITISEAQAAYARERIAKAGLNDRVEIRLQDYRDVPEHYDRVASIEMFEAVGERYWPVFFNALRDRLVSGGRAALQIITIDDQMFPSYRRGCDYIQAYIFPGGMLPSLAALRDQLSSSGLHLDGMQAFGRSYAETLKRWNRRFQDAWGDIAREGYDQRFKRMWEQYLDYCAAGFAVGTIDVVQIAVTRD